MKRTHIHCTSPSRTPFTARWFIPEPIKLARQDVPHDGTWATIKWFLGRTPETFENQGEQENFSNIQSYPTTIHQIRKKPYKNNSPYFESSLKFEFECVCVSLTKLPCLCSLSNKGFHSNSLLHTIRITLEKLYLTLTRKNAALLSLIPFSLRMNSLLITL